MARAASGAELGSAHVVSRHVLNLCKMGILGQPKIEQMLREARERADDSLDEIVTYQNSDGWTALMHACNTNTPSLVELLLENGAAKCVSARISDSYSISAGFSALHFAVTKCRDSEKMVSLLCEFGADVNRQTTTSRDTALHLLARRMADHPKNAALERCAFILIQYGSYLDLRNSHDETPLTLCPKLAEIEVEGNPTFRVETAPTIPSLEDLQPDAESPHENGYKPYHKSSLDMFLPTSEMKPRKGSESSEDGHVENGSGIADASCAFPRYNRSSSDNEILMGPRQPPYASYKPRPSRLSGLEAQLAKEQKKSAGYFEKWQSSKIETNSLQMRLNSLEHALEQERHQRLGLEEKVAELTKENLQLSDRLAESEKKLMHYLGRERDSASSSRDSPTRRIEYNGEEVRYYCEAKWPRNKGRGRGLSRAFKKDRYVQSYVVSDDNGFEISNTDDDKDNFLRLWSQVQSVKVDDTTMLITLNTNDRVKMTFPDRSTVDAFHREFASHFSVSQSLGGLT